MEGKNATEITVDDVLRILQKDIEIEDSDTDDDLSIVTNHEFVQDNIKDNSLQFEGIQTSSSCDDIYSSGDYCFIERSTALKNKYLVYVYHDLPLLRDSTWLSPWF